MEFKQVFLGIAILISLLQLANCTLCILRPMDRCINQCNQNSTTCYCEADVDGVVKHCKQVCDQPHSERCPNMVCKGGKTCVQLCGDAACNMTCSENTEYCHQNCSSPQGKCDILKCSSAECVQFCSNCTMICTEQVKQCKQTCLGGSCSLKCKARNCINACGEGNETQCEVDATENVDANGQVSKGSFMLLATLTITAIGFLKVS